MRIYVRYETPRETTKDLIETRREYNERLGVESPPFTIPAGYEHVWNWYIELSRRLRRIEDGVCWPISPSEFVAWCTATETVIRGAEYAMLCAMDEAFCSETNLELSAQQAKRDEEMRVQGKR